MQDPGYGLPRTPLLGTWVNRAPADVAHPSRWHHCMGCIGPAREGRVGEGRESPVSEAEEKNNALVRRFFEEVWAKGNVAAVDEFMAPDYVEQIEHTVPPGSRPGRDSVKQRIAVYHNAFPDMKVKIHDILAQGD